MGDREKAIERKRPEAILFDLGSTLLRDSMSGALNSRVRSLLKRETFAPFVENKIDLPAALADAMEAIYRDGLGEFHVRKWLEAYTNPRSGNPTELSETLESLIRSSIVSYSPPDDSERVLRELLRLGIPMGVVSNSIFSGDLLRNDLEAHSVLEAFRFVVSSAEFGLRKPHPAIFEYAVKKLKSRASETWYVGDLWENDVVGSSGAGLVPVWLSANAATPAVPIPHLRVKNWTELGEFLGIDSEF